MIKVAIHVDYGGFSFPEKFQAYAVAHHEQIQLEYPDLTAEQLKEKMDSCLDVEEFRTSQQMIRLMEAYGLEKFKNYAKGCPRFSILQIPAVAKDFISISDYDGAETLGLDAIQYWKHLLSAGMSNEDMVQKMTAFCNIVIKQ